MKKSNILNILINPLFVFSALLLLFVVISLHPFVSYDEWFWTYIGNSWRVFDIAPYTGVVENKTPGIFILYAIADIFDSHNILFLRLLGVLVAFFTTIFVYKICKKIADCYTAVISSYIFGLTFCWINLDGFAFAHTEIFMVFFLVLAFYILINYANRFNKLKWLFIVGLCIGGAIAFKQIAITTAIGLVIIYLVLNKEELHKTKLIGIFIIFSGIIIATLISCVPLFLSNVTLLDYIDGAWLILFNSGSKIESITMHFKNFIDVLVLSRLIMLLSLGVVFIYFRRKIEIKKMFFYVLIIWFAFDFIGINASGYYYGHQIKQILPSLSIISAVSIVYLASILRKKWTSFNKNPFFLIILVVLLLFPYRHSAITVRQLLIGPEISAYMPNLEVTDFIKNNTNESNYVYLLGGDIELLSSLARTNRKSSSRYLNSIFVSDTSHQKEVFKDIKNNPPKYILKHSNFSKLSAIYGESLENYFNENYTFLRTFGQVIVYQRK